MAENMTLMDKISELSLRRDKKGEIVKHPYFKAGDTIKVRVKIVEGSKTRFQVFQGYCMRRSGCGVNEIFSLRKESSGIGVERTFYINSPNLDKIEVLRKGRVTRGRLYYLRTVIGKKSRIREKQTIRASKNKRRGR